MIARAKIAVYVGGAVGTALLVALILHENFHSMALTLRTGGWPLLWVVPYRALYFALFALGWMSLLDACNRRRAGVAHVFWATSVREAVDRLLPVASVGGSLVGIRMLRWRDIDWAPASASVIVEIALNLVIAYVFTAAGLFLLLNVVGFIPDYQRLVLFFLITLPIPVVTIWLLRSGSLAQQLMRLLRPLIGAHFIVQTAAALDRELRLSLQRLSGLAIAGGAQLIAMTLGSVEIWWSLRLFEHRVGMPAAIALESMSLAVRHLAFMIPAGIGIQEAGLVLFGQTMGLDGELALSVSVVKRARELVWGVPSLLSWQWSEARRLHRYNTVPSRNTR